MAIDGAWNITINTPMGQQSASLTLSTQGAPSGTMAAMGNEQAIENIEVNGDNVSWSTDIASPMPMTLSFAGVVSGDAISGTVQLGGFGESDFSGTRA